MCPGSGIRYGAWNRCLHPQQGVTKVAGVCEGKRLAILTWDLVQERGQEPGIGCGGVGKKCSNIGSD